MRRSRDFSEFIACCAARDHVGIDVGGMPVPFIDVARLIADKRASGRPQDLADAEALAAPDVGSAG